MKTEPNDSMYPVIETVERAGEIWFAETFSRGGLTKREYFAALAMQGYCGGEFTGQSGMPPQQIAETCVSYADALIKALNSSIS